MDAKIKEKWLTALRSGEYKQTTDGALHKEDRFCCLGVLCDVVKDDLNVGWVSNNIDERYVMFDEEDFLPTEVATFVGLTEAPEVWREDADSLSSIAELNDDGFTFAELADLIEAQL